MKLDGGGLTSLRGDISILFRRDVYDYGVLELDTSIRDNGSIRVGLNISGGKGFVYLRPKESNTFTGSILVSGWKTLVLESSNGSISVSGNMNVKSGAKVLSRRSGQIAKHVYVTLQSRGGGSSISTDS